MGLLGLLKSGASMLGGLFGGRARQQTQSPQQQTPAPGSSVTPPNAYQPGHPGPGHLSRGSGGPTTTAGPGPAANRADFERYKDDLRAQMDRPHTQDPALSTMMGRLYRPGAQVGSGSTAAAVRHEQATGTQVGGREHTQKARDHVVALQRWLANNPDASPGDRAAAENVLRDMQNALRGS
jgi:hypothetical protein